MPATVHVKIAASGRARPDVSLQAVQNAVLKALREAGVAADAAAPVTVEGRLS